MPTYQFRCPDGTIIERFFKISEVPDSIPAPDGGDAVRIISGGAGLIFKGSGFYITDYGKDGKKDLRAAQKSDTASSAEGSKTSASASKESGSSNAPQKSSGESSSSGGAGGTGGTE